MFRIDYVISKTGALRTKYAKTSKDVNSFKAYANANGIRIEYVTRT